MPKKKHSKKNVSPEEEINDYEEPTHQRNAPAKNKKKSTKKNKKKYETDEILEENDSISDGDLIENDEPAPKVKIANKTHAKLKQDILNWLDDDDKIKELNAKTKKYKESKKEKENAIIKMINKMGMEDTTIDIKDDNDQLRGRVKRHKSVTQGAIKEDTIKKTLMEVIKDEKKVDQLVIKIVNNRPKTERYYLKRTKGNKDEKN